MSRIVGLQLCEAGRIAQRLFLMSKIARKARGGVKALSIVGMATEQIAQNPDRLSPITGASDGSAAWTSLWTWSAYELRS